MIKQSAELIFVPAPGMGHLMSAVEVAKLLVSRDPRLFISVLIIKFPFDSQITSSSESFISSSVADSTSQRINFIDLPKIQIDGANLGFINFLSSFFDDHKPLVRDAVNKLIESGSGPRLAGFVVDMFCSAMIDVADEFGVPSYVFFTSGAGCLSVMSHFQALNDDHNIDFTELNDKPDLELLVPGFLNPVPAKVLPGFLTDKAAVSLFFNNVRRTRKTEGILVNTFTELESNVIQSLSNKDSFPPVYPVGPVLNLNLGGADHKTTEVVAWLDNQPPSSVVFLCFGSMGSFREHQVKEIALALEKSGVRFLWSLRQPPQKGHRLPADYADPNEVLPEGFLNRTAEIGKVIGWAPQVTILAHPAVGGFVSHCGWNSTLESLWFGVPIATWPLYAEQQLNAFQMVRELGLAVEIKVDYRTERNNATGDDPDALILKAEEIERGIRSVMVQDSDIRKKVKEMSEKSKKGLLDGGASYSSLGRFIGDVMENMPLKGS